MTKAQERALTENDMTKIVFSGFEKTGRHLPQIQTAHFNEVKDEFKFAEIHQTFQHSQRINSYVVCYQTHCLRRHFPFIRQIHLIKHGPPEPIRHNNNTTTSGE